MRSANDFSRVVVFSIGCSVVASSAVGIAAADVAPTRRYSDLKLVADENGVPLRSLDGPLPGGWGAGDLQSAYGLPSDGGAGRVVAVWGQNVDVPDAEQNLAVYRAQYGLPPCTSDNGCFIKIDPNGGTNYPGPVAPDGELEQNLDLQMASAACPGCRIMLVEGGDLGVAVSTARALGASAFSFSVIYFYGDDFANAGICERAGFNDTAGMLVTASVGDGGYPSLAAGVPVACQGVVAVGGTSLFQDSSPRGWSESTWSGTGSWCSDAVAKPSWQYDPGCATRMSSDVSAVADLNTPVAVYNGVLGWQLAGGTSASAPLVAGAFTNIGVANGQFSPAWVWQNTGAFNDVTTGSNGTCPGQAPYVCNAGSGYDGPTGWGTPNGQLLAAALAPPYAAQVVSVSFPPTMTMSEGQVIPASIVLKNVGKQTWDSNTYIGTTGPRDRNSAFADATWVNPNRVAGVHGTVPPGGTYTFTFNLVAPGVGSYDEFFGVVEQGATWFSDPGQGGPADNALEAKIDVVAAGTQGGNDGDSGCSVAAARHSAGGLVAVLLVIAVAARRRSTKR